MAKTSEMTAEERIARRKAQAREDAAYEAPRLDRAAELLNQIAPLASELDRLAPEIISANVSIHLTAFTRDVDRARRAVVPARQALDLILSEEG